MCRAKGSDVQRGADAGFFSAEKMRPAKTLACYKWLILFKETEFYGGYFSGVSNA